MVLQVLPKILSSTPLDPPMTRICRSMPRGWRWGRRCHDRIDCFSATSCERSIGTCCILDGRLIDGTASCQPRQDLHLICVAVKGFHSSPQRFSLYRFCLCFSSSNVHNGDGFHDDESSHACPHQNGIIPIIAETRRAAQERFLGAYRLQWLQSASNENVDANQQQVNSPPPSRSDDSSAL